MGFLNKGKDKDVEVVGHAEFVRRLEEVKEVFENLNLAEETARLRREIADLEIQKSKVDEERARKDRDTDHKVALALREADHEKEVAVKEAELAVREANLDTEREQAKEGVQQIKDAVKSEQEATRHMLDRVMNLIPQVHVDRKITEHHGDPLGLPAGDEEGTAKERS